MSTRIHQKFPRKFTLFVHEKLPFMSTRCLPPHRLWMVPNKVYGNCKCSLSLKNHPLIKVLNPLCKGCFRLLPPSFFYSSLLSNFDNNTATTTELLYCATFSYVHKTCRFCNTRKTAHGKKIAFSSQ